MFANVTGTSFGLGLATALDSLGSQAYGAKQYSLVGLYTQRGMMISTAVCIPIIIIWSYTKEFLELVGVAPHIAVLSGEWVSYLRFACWPNFMYYMLARFQQCQGIVWITTASSVICVLSNLALTPALIYSANLGYKGAAIAQALTYWVLFLSVVFFGCARCLWVKRIRNRAIVVSDSQTLGAHEPLDIEDTWVDPMASWPSPFRLAVFRGWPEFLKLGIPGAASLFVEWGSYEITSMVAASLGETPLAVHALFATTATLNYAAPLGLSTAGSILIGQFLGAGSPDRARQLTVLCVACTAVYGIASGFLLLALRVPYAMMFTSESGVIDGASVNMWVLIPYFITDHIKCTFMAVLRSCGRPQIAFYLSIFACWAVGFPVIYLLVFEPLQLGLVGIWTGMSAAWGTCGVTFGFVIWRTNWQIEADNARERNQKGLESGREQSPLIGH
jgi:MATE family multidrug resistance protein